jgi:hypothetical protein
LKKRYGGGIEVTGMWGRRRKEPLDELEGKTGYWKVKE